MERGDPTLYYGTKQLYFGRVDFKFTGGGNRKTCYQKKKKEKKKKKVSGRRGLISTALYYVSVTISAVPR